MKLNIDEQFTFNSYVWLFYYISLSVPSTQSLLSQSRQATNILRYTRYEIIQVLMSVADSVRKTLWASCSVLEINWKTNFAVVRIYWMAGNLTMCFIKAMAYRTITMNHYSDVIMGAMAYQITSLTIVNSTVYSGADQRKHQSSPTLAFVRGIHRWPVNSLHKWPVTRKMFPFDDVIMEIISEMYNICTWCFCFVLFGLYNGS